MIRTIRFLFVGLGLMGVACGAHAQSAGAEGKPKGKNAAVTKKAAPAGKAKAEPAAAKDAPAEKKEAPGSPKDVPAVAPVESTTAATPATEPKEVAAAGAEAEESAPVVVGAQLTDAEMAGAAKIDALSIPTPGELLVAVGKLGTPDWSSAFRAPISTSYSSRPQMALNIGGLIADGFIAVEAEDAQQVKNTGKDVIALAKPLGVQQDIINRGKSLTDFAERGEWDTLKEELEATQNEVKAAMIENKDPDLITLVTLGGWIRGVEAMADYVSKHYTAEGARLLRQPGVARFLSDRLRELPERVRDDASVRKARDGLTVIETAVSLPSETPLPQKAVADLAVSVKALLREIAAKKK